MISIVICCFNDSERLVKAIPSCANQVPGQELILVDDGSSVPFPPNIQALLRVYGVKVVRHAENRGLSAARNTGVAASKFPFFVPLDSDDFFQPHTLAKLLAAMNGEADVVYGNVIDNGIDPKPGAKDVVHYPVPQPWTAETFKAGNPMFCGSLYRKSMWEKVGGYTVRTGPDKLLYEDYRLNFMLYKAGARFKYVDVNVYYHTSRVDGMLRKMHPDRENYKRLTLDGLL